MGGQHAKSIGGSTANESRHHAIDGVEVWPSGAELSNQTSPWSGQTVCSRLRDWNSVKRTVNDLYQDGKHAFNFSPTDPHNYNNNVNVNENEHAEPKVNKRNSDGRTPLTFLIHNSDVDAVRELLLNPGVDVNYPEGQLYCGYRWDFYPPSIVAINSENIDMVRLLLLSGASVNDKDSQGFSALYHASKQGNTAMVALLLSHMPDLSPPPAFDTCTITDPLHIACCHGHTDVAELLIKAGCPVNAPEDNMTSPLDRALDSGNEAVCLLLLQHGAKINEKLFFKACQYGCEQTVQYMIESGINVRAVTEFKESALMFALSPGSLNRLKRKLAYITDVENARNMAYEILQHDVNLVNLLCENGCDLEVQDRMQHLTVLYRSWQLQNMPAVIVLLKHGAYFNLDHYYLHIGSVNDDVFNELSDLYMTFVHSHIPEDIFRRRTRVKQTDKLTSLQHLCRLTIRNTMKSCRKSSSSIIIGIKNLKLPTRLKDYLCYSEINEMDRSYCDTLFKLSYNSPTLV